MLWKSSCDAEVAEAQIQRQKCCLWLKIAENLFQLLAFPILRTLQGAVKVTGWLCVCGACLRSLICATNLLWRLETPGLPQLSAKSGGVMMPVPAGSAQ